MEHDDSQTDEERVASNIFQKLSPKLRDRLLPFQKEGVIFAVQKNGRCLIADEMGLGKTLQAISVAYFYKDEWPLLIIVPSSLKFCWIEELERWLPDILPQDINLVQCGSDVSGMASCPITIVTYGLLRLPSSKVIREALSARKFQVVICDESHYLKNINTMSSKVVTPLLKGANRRLLLSGTPALAKPVELYCQIDAICPGRFGSYKQYTDRYCDAHTVFFGKFRKRQVDGASNLEELQQKLKNFLMIRREKCDVLTQLPPKQRQRILFELKNSSLKKEILDSFSELKRVMQKEGRTVQKILHNEGPNSDESSCLLGPETAPSTESSVGVYSLISRLYRMSGEAKTGPVREYIEMLCKNEQLKFLVFAYHHDMMDSVQQTLYEKKVKFVRIDGSTKSSDRQAYVNQFQSDPDTRVAILSILAAGVGLTFTAAKLVVFAELYWTPGVMIQCEDRAHRIGQTDSLPVHYLVARDTMDEWVWSAVCKKTLVTSAALSGKSQKLQHCDGDSYQVELLSNADVWRPEVADVDMDVARLVRSQKPDDQSTILEFFPSQRSTGSPLTTCKRRHETGSERSAVTPVGVSVVDGKHYQRSKVKVSDPESLKSADGRQDKDDKVSEVVIVSDDEDDFKPSRKVRKTENRKMKSKEQKESRTLKNGRLVRVTKSDKFNSDSEKIVNSHLRCSEKILTSDVSSSEKIPNSDLSSSEKILASDLMSPKTVSTTCPMSDMKRVPSLEISVVTDPQSPSKEQLMCDSLDWQLKGKSKGKYLYSCGDCKHEVCCESLQDPGSDYKHDVWSRGEEFSCPHDGHLHSTEDRVIVMCQRRSSDEKQQQMKRAECDQWSCDACTFLNHPELPQCEICDTPKKKTVSMNQRGTRKKLASTGRDFDDNACDTDAASSESVHGENMVLTEEAGKKNGSSDVKDLQCERSWLGAKDSSRAIDTLDCLLPFASENIIAVKEEQVCTAGLCNHGKSDVRKPKADLGLASQSRVSLEKNLSPSLVFEAACESQGECPDFSFGKNSKSQEHFSKYPDLTETFEEKLQPCPSGSSGQSETPGSSVTCQQNAAADLTQETHNSVLKFSCSIHSGRIYVYDEDEKFLQASFHPIDVEMGHTSELPELLRQPVNLRPLQKFIREWCSLTDTKKRLIAKRCLIFSSPRAAYEDIKTVRGNKQRHLDKQDTLSVALRNAGKLGGSVRVISRHKTAPAHLNKTHTEQHSTPLRGVAQAVTEDGVPLCLQCQRPYKNPLLSTKTISDPANAWELRLCSFTCMDKYWTLSKSSYCRDLVYDVEHGVCQLCQYDAEALYRQTKITKDLIVRADIISKSPYRALAEKQRQKMIEQPLSGQFWHVDHITPVWQGGGLCDLDNLRTLCTPCHLKVTCRQAGQRATAKKLAVAANQRDISAFFQRS